ncbi:PilZ domain-containing protein [Desulfotomaculum sp. 1211_IL3151]|uniref:PilZ domain-containing protein n=1 Tax=Desulfotomaculum sp. 1211_IL3151 TaxID=3084055 RepID=UPI002FDB601F
MSSNQGPFTKNSLITMRDVASGREYKGHIIADYGTYLVINPEQEAIMNPGQPITVALTEPDKSLVFDSYICFLGQDLKNQFCVYVPPNLGKKKKRKYLRLGVELTMLYRVDEREVHTKTINISAGGVYFFTPKRLVSGQDIEIELHLPQHTITIGATVLRTMLNAASVEFYEDMEKIHLLAAYLYRCSLLKNIQEETP